MPDWHKAMQQTFEYYTVNPNTWRDDEKLSTVISCQITRDSEMETLGSASIDVTDSLGECYIRVYLVTIQNGITERFPLGTYLVQTPSKTFNGKYYQSTVDAYTPLLELKENPPPLGYSILKSDKNNIMEKAYMLAREHARAPVIKSISDDVMEYDFIADTDDTWLSFITDLVANAKYEISLDENGRIMFSPNQNNIAALQPVWTYNDDNSSILYPELSIDRDFYGIPNVVEVVYSGTDETFYSRVSNEDPNSPTSTVSRKREITYRDTSPSIYGIPSQSELDEYAMRLLSELSTVESTVSYSHGYCPVRLGDCIRLNYSRAELTNVKAKVISQTIDCTTGCKVTEKAVLSNRLCTNFTVYNSKTEKYEVIHHEFV